MRVSLGRGIALLSLACAVLASFSSSAQAAEEFNKYEIESVSTSLTSPQAGAHADFAIGFELSSKPSGEPWAQTRDIEVALPPGMIGNPQAFPRCSVVEFGNLPEESECPTDSQVGVSEVTVAGTVTGSFSEPIYNLEVPKNGDVVARFGFFAAAYPAMINVRIDPSDYSVVATVEGAPSASGLVAAINTLWGVPADSSHDLQRITPFEALNGGAPPGGRKAGLPPRPFMTNPTDCTLQRDVTVTARSYQLPNQPSTMSAPFPQIIGCDKLTFQPTFTAVPTNPEASAPTGLETTLTMPQDETPLGRATSTLKSARVTFPEGLSINPAAGAGLEACSAEQVGFGKNADAACPQGAKIGSLEADVPALENTLHGAVYQRTPEPGKLFRLWLVADEQGAHLKLPGEIEANPQTGQLSAVFAGIDSLGGLPQVPVSELRLRVFGGPLSPLSTPPRCGSPQTRYSFTPWSGKPAIEGATAMQITQGCHKGGFSPRISAVGTGSTAGDFFPFAFTLTREDGEANPQTIAVHLPQGLLAKVKGVPLCPEAAAATGTCPADSRIGSITAAAGVGSSPLWIPQPGKAPPVAYLAGPYKGAPYSVVSVVPAQAGPFDLGLVVNRAAIQIDPETARATVVTDPLPQFLEGVPISYRTLHVLVDRPNFMLNPTGCASKKVVATVTATTGAVAEPSDGFRATGCERLRYTPKLKLSFTGSTKRTGNPGVKAVLTQKPHQANSKAAVVLLPASQFIDNSHISNPCTRVQFAAEECPAGSILGTARAVSPLLDRPLKGKVYFRSNGGARELPDIVVDMKGQIRVTLVGFIDSVPIKGTESSRVRTRFLGLPDAPVTKFTVNFFAGKRSLIENSRNLCQTGRRAEIDLKAQNGLTQHTAPVIAASCKRS